MYGLVWFGRGGCMMTSKFINEEISMLFFSKKFYGGGGVWYGVIIESISRSRPETRECL